MMKHEFDSLVGITTNPECYERIEFVYMNSNKFNTKQEIADFYKKHDMNGIENIYKELLESEERKQVIRSDEFKSFINDLAVFADGYVNEIKNHLVDIAITTFQDKTVVTLLHQYVVRVQKEQDDLIHNMLWDIEHPESKTDLNNSCLTNAASYKTVLADLLVNEWWHEQCKKDK